ncbi:hypothetical protein RND81_07G186300 [Saponaria officinalis]|uniref:F-box associated beta-propeller type 3 domain-containing protein n=1 Tax=Saponaria officinalis TaxID=3572 RepID=A0AAW1JTE4_SAPOF
MIDYPMSIYVYLLRNNSWRYVGDLKNSYYFKERSSYNFVNGCYYWLGSRKLDVWNCYEMVISFDVGADVYEEIRLPKFEHMPNYGSQLVVYHDSIGFVCVRECRTMFDVWILMKDGAWTRKLTVEVGFEVWGPFCHWRDNTFLFREAGSSKVVLCDIDTNETQVVTNDPQVEQWFDRIIIHKESLVSIKEFSTEAQLEDGRP